MVDVALGQYHEHPTMIGGLICKSRFFGLRTLCIGMRNIRNNTNHEETNCGMDRNVSELHRMVVYSTMHLCSRQFGFLFQLGYH